MLTLYFSPGVCSTASHIGKQYSVADAYALVFYGWGTRSEYVSYQKGRTASWQQD